MKKTLLFEEYVANYESTGRVLSEKLEGLLNEQVYNEMYNSNLYLRLSHYFDNLELLGFSTYFSQHSTEEKQHAQMVLDFMGDMNCDLKPMEVPASTEKVGSPNEACLLYLNAELKTTDQLNKISKAALEEDDHMTHSFVHAMLTEQISEIREANTLYVKTKGAGKSALLVIDSGLTK